MDTGTQVNGQGTNNLEGKGLVKMTLMFHKRRARESTKADVLP